MVGSFDNVFHPKYGYYYKILKVRKLILKKKALEINIFKNFLNYSTF